VEGADTVGGGRESAPPAGEQGGLVQEIGGHSMDAFAVEGEHDEHGLPNDQEVATAREDDGGRDAELLGMVLAEDQQSEAADRGGGANSRAEADDVEMELDAGSTDCECGAGDQSGEASGTTSVPEGAEGEDDEDDGRKGADGQQKEGLQQQEGEGNDRDGQQRQNEKSEDEKYEADEEGEEQDAEGGAGGRLTNQAGSSHDDGEQRSGLLEDARVAAGSSAAAANEAASRIEPAEQVDAASNKRRSRKVQGASRGAAAQKRGLEARVQDGDLVWAQMGRFPFWPAYAFTTKASATAKFKITATKKDLRTLGRGGRWLVYFLDTHDM